MRNYNYDNTIDAIDLDFRGGQEKHRESLDDGGNVKVAGIPNSSRENRVGYTENRTNHPQLKFIIRYTSVYVLFQGWFFSRPQMVI